jgi:hypothetical protein
MGSIVGPRRRGRSLTRGRAVAIVLAGLTLTGAVVAGGANARGTATSSTTATACPTGALAFTSNLTNGSMKIGRVASVSGGSAKACGAITAGADGALVATIDKSNVTFAPTQTTALILRLPTTVKAVGNLSGPATIAADGQHVTLTGPVEATANLLGSRCVLALSPGLTTDTSGRLTGQPLKDDGTGTGTAKGRLVANAFSVPAIRPTRECPAAIAAMTNLMLGLPLGKGQSSVTFDVSLKLGV